jgi:hypothetical protein
MTLQVKHRPAAILAADAVGYSRMVGAVLRRPAL